MLFVEFHLVQLQHIMSAKVYCFFLKSYSFLNVFKKKKKGKPICEKDYFGSKAASGSNKCAKCESPLSGDVIEVNGVNWHVHCNFFSSGFLQRLKIEFKQKKRFCMLWLQQKIYGKSYETVFIY